MNLRMNIIIDLAEQAFIQLTFMRQLSAVYSTNELSNNAEYINLKYLYDSYVQQMKIQIEELDSQDLIEHFTNVLIENCRLEYNLKQKNK